MKREEIYRTHYTFQRQFTKSVDTCIEFDNTRRPHSTLNYRIPDHDEAICEIKKELQVDLDNGPIGGLLQLHPGARATENTLQRWYLGRETLLPRLPAFPGACPQHGYPPSCKGRFLQSSMWT